MKPAPKSPAAPVKPGGGKPKREDMDAFVKRRDEAEKSKRR